MKTCIIQTQASNRAALFEKKSLPSVRQVFFEKQSTRRCCKCCLFRFRGQTRPRIDSSKNILLEAKVHGSSPMSHEEQFRYFQIKPTTVYLLSQDTSLCLSVAVHYVQVSQRVSSTWKKYTASR